MTIATEKTVRELALESPASTRVFEKLGIDYCCGGNKSLEEACHAANLKIDQVLDSLNQANQAALVVQTEQNWNAEPLASLIGHIQSTHHNYTRDEIARLCPLLEKVCSVHGKNHPELVEVQEAFKGLARELGTHMMKEEMILFPFVIRMEAAVAGKEAIAPAPFGSVHNPVAMMEHEHDSAGECSAHYEAGEQGIFRTNRWLHQLSNALQGAGERLKLTFISIFIWRTTFYFLAPWHWRRRVSGVAHSFEQNIQAFLGEGSHAIQKAVDRVRAGHVGFVLGARRRGLQGHQ